jgi:crotonobetainyl-CoA:carnitine CoA-transferase CaiB-like acyl-CoA transferase
VAESDVLLSNFKPGTLDSLGIGPDVLLEINPSIVVLDNSALGNTGPLSRSLGYGPLVRAATGMTALWSYPEEPGCYGDGVTIYPDHVAARVAAVGVLAALIRRHTTGRGGRVSVSQAEVFLNSVAEEFLHESLRPGAFRPRGNHSIYAAPDSVFPCGGDDEWCAISVSDDEQWQRLASAMGRADLAEDARLSTTDGRLAHREEVEAAVTVWTLQHTARQITELLQAQDVPAGFMQRLSEYRDDPHFAARRFIRELTHPGLPEPLPTENTVVTSLHRPEPELRPAPYLAEHTVEVARRLLGLDAAEVEKLIADGHLEDVDPAELAM